MCIAYIDAFKNQKFSSTKILNESDSIYCSKYYGYKGQMSLLFCLQKL